MVPSCLGLLVLFLLVWRSAETEVIGVIGRSIELKCRYPEKVPFIYNKTRILWQIKGKLSCFVAAHFPNEDMGMYQCQEFRGRALLEDQLKQGSFTLHLMNISTADDHIYQCIIQKVNDETFEPIHNEFITLHVAANYNKPVITGPILSGEEMTFMCNSSQGYPQQKLYWINEMDNRPVNTTVQYTKELDGSFSVFSTLKMKATTNIKLWCMIEHEQLHQNFTTFYLNNSTKSPVIYDNRHKIAAGLSVVSVGVVVLIGYLSWKRRAHCLQRTYSVK